MNEIGYSSVQESARAEMRTALETQITHLIINAIALYVERDVIDEAFIQYNDLENMAEFIKNLAEKSPSAQMAILEALDNFYEETVQMYNEFK